MSAIGQPRVLAGRLAAWDATSPSSAQDDRVLLAAVVPIAGALIVGMAANIGILTTLAAGMAILIAVVWPMAGLVLLAFLGPLKPPDVVPAALPAVGFNVILVAAIVLGCVYRLPIDRPRVRVGIPVLLLLAFLLYTFVQQSPEMMAGYGGVEPKRIGALFVQFGGVVATVIVAGYILYDRSPDLLLAACLAGACVASLLALVVDGLGFPAAPLAGLLATGEEGARAVGPFANPNYFGEFLATAMVTAIGWAMMTRRPNLRWPLIGAAVLIGFGLALSLSRGAITATLVGIACLAILRSRKLGAAVIALGLVGAVVLYPIFVEWRLGSASDTAFAALDASDAGRLSAILAGPQLFLTSPLIGVGFGQYSILSAQFTPSHVSIGSHNWYMNVLAEQGLVGAVLWSLLLVSVLVQLQSRPSPARVIGLGVLAVYAAGSLFTTQPVSLQTSVLALIVLAAALVGDWRRDSTEDDSAVSSAVLAAPAPSRAG